MSMIQSLKSIAVQIDIIGKANNINIWLEAKLNSSEGEEGAITL